MLKFMDIINKIRGEQLRTSMIESSDATGQLQRNIGDDLHEWPQRCKVALNMITADTVNHAIRVADYGCGKQTLRRLIPDSWEYIPFDYCSRSPDTIICDFNSEIPAGKFDIIFCLGVLEYLDDPLGFISNTLSACGYFLFSYNGFTTGDRRKIQGWRNNLRFADIEKVLADKCARVAGKEHLENNEWVYLVKALGE